MKLINSIICATSIYSPYVVFDDRLTVFKTRAPKFPYRWQEMLQRFFIMIIQNPKVPIEQRLIAHNDFSLFSSSLTDKISYLSLFYHTSAHAQKNNSLVMKISLLFPIPHHRVILTIVPIVSLLI